jgi:hypothetical protein
MNGRVTEQYLLDNLIHKYRKIIDEYFIYNFLSFSMGFERLMGCENVKNFFN